jgi:hypothetical protein
VNRPTDLISKRRQPRALVRALFGKSRWIEISRPFFLVAPAKGGKTHVAYPVDHRSAMVPVALRRCNPAGFARVHSAGGNTRRPNRIDFENIEGDTSPSPADSAPSGERGGQWGSR